MSVDMDRRRSFPHPGIVLPPIKGERMGHYCLIPHQMLPGIVPGIIIPGASYRTWYWVLYMIYEVMLLVHIMLAAIKRVGYYHLIAGSYLSKGPGDNSGEFIVHLQQPREEIEKTKQKDSV